MQGFLSLPFALGRFLPSLPSVLPLLGQGHWLSRAEPEGSFGSAALRRSQLAKWLELRRSKWSFPGGPAVTALRLIKPLIIIIIFFCCCCCRCSSWTAACRSPRPCREWLLSSLLRFCLSPTPRRFGWRKAFPGHTSRDGGILGIIRHAGGRPLIKWLLGVASSPLLIGVNCKQKLLVVWSAVVMILSPPPIPSVRPNGFQMWPTCQRTNVNICGEAWKQSYRNTEVFQLHEEVYSEIQSNFNAELPLLTFLTVSTHRIITFRIFCLLMFAKNCRWKHKDGDLRKTPACSWKITSWVIWSLKKALKS